MNIFEKRADLAQLADYGYYIVSTPGMNRWKKFLCPNGHFGVILHYNVTSGGMKLWKYAKLSIVVGIVGMVGIIVGLSNLSFRPHVEQGSSIREGLYYYSHIYS